MTTEHRYSIKYVCLRTGLKPHLIRSWESRYRAIRPRRTASNRRVFTDDDIHRLYLLKLAVASGHTISHVARLGDPDLKRLLAKGARRVGDTDRLASVGASAAQGAVPRDGEKMVDAALDHVTGLDPGALEKILNQAAVEMPRQALLQSVILPLFLRIGQLWRLGKIKAIHEQVASVAVRAMLSEMLRAVVVPSSAPKIIVATPTGHWHELGALSAALAASASGWRVVYCGPNLPADEIAYAVVKLHGQAVALGISHALDDNRLAAELRLLRRLVGASLPIFVSGIGADVHRMPIRPTHATVCDHLGELRDRLDRLLDAVAARSTPAAPRHPEIRDAPLR